jgi:hypothetical protein
VKASIRECNYNNDVYPGTKLISDKDKATKWLPILLFEFLIGILNNDLKVVSLGHSIVQAARPRSAFSLVLFGVGVSLDHVLGPQQLLELLS